MNVLITNQQEALLSNLNVEIIKTLRGEFDVEEIIGTFSNFFFGRMILDMTALREYSNIITFQKLSIGLPVDKIILLIPENTEFSSPQFLSKLISMGFYNFTTNIDGIRYLLDHPNSYKDVAHIHQIESTGPATTTNNNNQTYQQTQQLTPRQTRILGFKNVTLGAGSTTLVYLMQKELSELYNIRTVAIELNRTDFTYFNNPALVSISDTEIQNTLAQYNGYDVILVDLNNNDGNFCTDIVYLVEPSLLKINQVLSQDRELFRKLAGKKVLLNKALLSNEEIGQLINETGLNVWAAVHPLNDRSKQPMVTGLLKRLGLVSSNTSVPQQRGLFGKLR